MTARPPKRPRVSAALSATLAALVLFVACSMPAPDAAVAPRAADPTITGPIAAPGVFFDFQVERPASAHPSNMPPMYPPALRSAGVEGRVTARFVVDTTGRADTSTIEIVMSDHAEFTSAVREGLSQLRFFPARVADRPVKQMVTMPFTFSLVGKDRLVKDEIQLSGKPEVLARPRVGRVDILTETAVGAPGEFPEALARFKPALKDGAPVSRLMDMPFIFKLSR